MIRAGVASGYLFISVDRVHFQISLHFDRLRNFPLAEVRVVHPVEIIAIYCWHVQIGLCIHLLGLVPLLFSGIGGL